MFAGGAAAGRLISSNNVRNMQLFHELKQKFPTVPDHVVSSCIATHNANPATTSLNDLLLLHQQQQQQQQSREQSEERLNNSNNHGDHMGGRNTITAPPAEVPCPAPLDLSDDNDDNTDNVAPRSPDNEDLHGFELVVAESATSASPTTTTPHDEMHAANNMPYYPHKSPDQVKSPQCDTNGDDTETKPSAPRRFVKNQRPNNLAVKSIHNASAKNKSGSAGLHKIQPSERYNDLHTLLNSNDTTTAGLKKPPRSPVGGKHPPPVIAPKPGRPQTVASQTTDTLLMPPHSPTSNVNLSLNVVVSPSSEVEAPTPPPKPRHTTNLNMVPEAAWMQPSQSGQSGRSYTSVNLTLRPPMAEPQAPIDITSQNATLTYSTSSFDRTRGLQSRLEISVGPGGQSTVSSVRRQRPKSSYHPVLNGLVEDGVGNSVVCDGVAERISAQTTAGNLVAAGSLPNLAADEKATTVILEQQVCINRLRIELRTEKTRLVAMQREVADLEAIAAAAALVTTTTTTTTTTVATAAVTTPPTTAKVIATTDYKTEDIEVERQLQREIRHLRGQCEQLADAVDQRSQSGVPLGETSREFYQNIYTGQQGSISVTSSATADYTGRRIATVTSQGSPGAPGTPPPSTPSPGTPGRPPRPPLPYPFQRPQQPNNSQVRQQQDETEDQSCWNCSVCTFQNHPLLNKCEQCEMLRGNTPTTTHTNNPPPPPYSQHPPSTPTTPNSARTPPRSNHHSLTPPRSWLSSNNPNNAGAVTPGDNSSSSSSASTPGSTNKGYPVQQYQMLPPGYIPSPYGGPPTPLPWVFPSNSMPVNTNPAVYNMQNSAYYVANSDGFVRRSSEGSGLRPAPPIPGTPPPGPQLPPRAAHHSRSLSQPDSRHATGRSGTAHR